MVLESVTQGFIALLTVQAIGFLLIGVVYGLVIGVLPGLGGVVAMALLLPFSYGFEPAATLALLLGAHIATIWGDSVTSILFNVPGSSKSLALMFDGYPLTRQGQARRALGASAGAAFLGGIIGAVFLAISIPIVRPLMLSLGSSEYLIMALWGMTVIASFSAGSILKGLIAASAGLIIAFIGMDPVTATPRFTFGAPYLLDGINIPVAMIGLFAVSEMIKLYVRGGAIVSIDAQKEKSSAIEGFKEAFRHWSLVLRSSALGVWIGVLPGIGATVGGIAAYAQAMQSSKHPETFGKGNIEGVIAPDATLGANEGGALLPTLVFGIPGGEAMAILLIAFLGIGIDPGPKMLTDGLHIVFTLVWIVVFASVAVTIIGLACIPLLARMPTLKENLMIPIVLAICFIGAYATRGQMEDLVVAVVFGILGYIMDKYRYSRANLVIGIVLATMIERNLHVSLTLYGEWFLFTRPITLILFILLAVTSALPFVRRRQKRKRERAARVVEGGPLA